MCLFDVKEDKSYRDLDPEEDEMKSLKLNKGVMGVVPGIIGTMQAAEAIKWITKCVEPLCNRLFTIDVLTMESHIIDL